MGGWALGAGGGGSNFWGGEDDKHGFLVGSLDEQRGRKGRVYGGWEG